MEAQSAARVSFEESRQMVVSEAPTPSFLIYRQSPVARRARRCADIVLASVVGMITAPILIIALLAIGLEDGAPLIFKQRRVGRFGRFFTIYKLRTIRTVSCGDAYKPVTGDPRITRVGALLRKLSIDELPQLWNVFRGDMCIVGPRPEMPFIVRGYHNWQHLRHLVTPGLTCIWQTECRSDYPLDHPAATMTDLQYIEQSSIAFDARLIVRTFTALTIDAFK